MSLREAIDDFRRNQDHPTLFPGERRTTSGLFSGSDDRLIHVDRDGQLRDYSYSLCGLNGIESSKFGLELDGRTVDFEEFTLINQGYHKDTTLVETTYEEGGVTVSRYDLTLDRTHVTHLDVSGDVPEHSTLWTVQRYAPDGQLSRVGQLDHGDVIEVFHREERDILTASTPITNIVNPSTSRFDAVLSASQSGFLKASDSLTRQEDPALGTDIILKIDLAAENGSASTTLVSLLTDGKDVDHEAPLTHARETASAYQHRSQLRESAEAHVHPKVPTNQSMASIVSADLRVLQLLSAASGARIAGPDFDPFFAHSGGYGYTWFRDDAEISRFLLEAEQPLNLDLDDWHDRSAQFYCKTQCDDGTWPHRVWADSGELAPGWAHGRLETGRGYQYQADQTASVITFLATYLRERDPENPERIKSALIEGFDGLDSTLQTDGLPEACQNAWENDTGRFTHTAATFLGAYSTLARAPMAEDVRERARERAEAVAAGLDQLWCTDRGIFATALSDGVRDERLDASTLALPAAHAEYAALNGGLDETRRRRLTRHVERTLDGLYHETDAIAGIRRFEGDPWRRRDQDSEKIWSVSTAWGAHAAAVLATLLGSPEERSRSFDARARQLLGLVLPDGPLCLETGYLAEQYFDNGMPDSATPLGWSHAIRLATVAHIEA